MNYVIDTNIFLRVLIKEDKKVFQDSINVLEAVKRKTFTTYIPGIVLSELAWTLRSYYQFPKPKVINALQGVLNLRGVTLIDEYDYRVALDLYAQNAVKYVDACIASLPLLRSQQATLISYDRDFDKLGILRKEPADIAG